MQLAPPPPPLPVIKIFKYCGVWGGGRQNPTKDNGAPLSVIKMLSIVASGKGGGGIGGAKNPPEKISTPPEKISTPPKKNHNPSRKNVNPASRITPNPTRKIPNPTRKNLNPAPQKIDTPSRKNITCNENI